MNSQAPRDYRGRILVVDDVTRNLQLVGTSLRDAGYEVIPATSGPQALERVREVPPDLVLLDLMMPGMDGLEVCRRLKADESTRAIPVMFLTASDEMQYLLAGFEVGAADYVTKPFNAAELLLRVHTHVELAQARAHLQRVNDDKNEFMGMLAHNLRNPLGTVIGNAGAIRELARRLAGDDERARHVARDQIQGLCDDLVEESRVMARMISDLLDANRIERGEMRPELVPTDLEPILASVAETWQPRAAAKGQELRFEPPVAATRAAIDPGLAAQVFENLVSNAVKYTPPGKRIELRLARAGAAARVEVRDEGPGIRPEDLGRLFGTFVRLGHVPTGGEQSTGLGLSIVKRIVELMDGRVWCESQPGQGATFVVEFPSVA